MSDVANTLSLPNALAGFILGGSICAGATYYWFDLRVGFLETQKQQLVSANTELESTVASLQGYIRTAQQNQCQPQQTQISSLQSQVKQLAQTNFDWEDEYKKLQQANQHLANSAQLSQRLEGLRETWRRSARSVEQFSNFQCSDAANSCDLNPLSQRRLRALEAERDQLHAQVLDLQARITCPKP